MDIFSFAIKMEQDGEKFYREMADQINEKGIRNILLMLADDEVKHAQAIERIQSHSTEMADTEILDRSRNIFERMKDFHEDFDFDHSHEELYRQAMKI